MTLITRNAAETLALGRRLGSIAPPGTCIALHGPLGAGKTQLTRGIALGAGVGDPSLVSSPTFVLLNIYQGHKPVYHLDAYRIRTEEDFAAVGFEELLDMEDHGGLVVVEWAERIAGLLPADHLSITISVGETEEERTLDVRGTGPATTRLTEQLVASLSTRT